MQYFIGIDDTDNLESRGTGHLARVMAIALSKDFRIHGVTRHQLLQDERVPMTAKNSCAAIIFEGDSHPLGEIALFARRVMLDDYQPGSDPGLCVAAGVPPSITAYGKRAQQEFLHQGETRKLAVAYDIFLEGLGGDENGVIGALAAVGLAASGEDGRYVQVGTIREMEGILPLNEILSTDISSVKTLSGETVSDGMILADKLRPARRGGQPVLFVERRDDYWLPLKLD
jgi:tRNA(Ile2) C34 agmatinyltransferase TiaS